MKFIVLCAQGLEDIVISEIKEKGNVENIEIYDGIILFDFKEDVKILLELKTVDDILVFVKKLTNISRYKKSLWEIRKQLANVNFKKSLFIVRKVRKTESDTTYTIKSSYKGRRDYTAKEISNSIKRIVKKNYDWKYKEEDAELYFHAILTNNISLLGLSLDKLPLHVTRRIKTIPGSLKYSVACSLLKIADVNKKDTVLDPMCGSGVIAIEADKIGANIIAGDIDKKIIEIAKQNSKKIDFRVWDAKRTELKDKSVDKIISNLPFDKQVKLADKEVFFENFIKEMLRVSKNNFTWFFLTRQENILKNIIKKYGFKVKSLNIINSGLESEILLIKKQ